MKHTKASITNASITNAGTAVVSTKNLQVRVVLFGLLSLLALSLLSASRAYGQITPLGDAYTDSTNTTKNNGAATTLGVDGTKYATYIEFNLGSIPSGATVSQATLKLYVNSVTSGGSFNVDYVASAWAENKIDFSNAPPLGAAIASNVSVATSEKNQFILIDVTSALQAWLSGSETNNGLALVANGTFNATFDSKENTTTSHPPELDVVFAGGGTITGVTTASGSGLTGGGTSGTLNLGLTTACATNQVLQWNGSAWACASAGSGTITGVTAGRDLTGGGTSGNVTLNLDTTKVPLLASANTFTANQTITGGLTAGSLTASGATFNGLVSIPAGSNDAISASSSSSSATTIFGLATSTSGDAWGVEGVTFSGAANAYGVYGFAESTTGNPIGTYGSAASAAGVGAYGQNGSQSTTGASLTGFAIGTWGDGGTNTINGAIGMVGSVDDGNAGVFENNSPSGYTALAVFSDNSDAGPFYAAGTSGNCNIDASGNLNCTGSKNAVVPVDGGKRTVAMSAIESPQNWFEDFGSAELVNGAAVVELDTTFIQTVNTEKEYFVVPVPNGDCKGLYVGNRTASSFEVHELGGGTSNIHFTYRITAIRKNYETVRFADRTQRMEHLRLERERLHAGAGHPVSHDPVKKPQPVSSIAAAKPVTVR